MRTQKLRSHTRRFLHASTDPVHSMERSLINYSSRFFSRVKIFSESPARSRLRFAEEACGKLCSESKTTHNNIKHHYKINIHQRYLTSQPLLADKAQNQTISATDVASAIEEENRITKYQQTEALKDKLIEMKKRLEKH